VSRAGSAHAGHGGHGASCGKQSALLTNRSQVARYGNRGTPSADSGHAGLNVISHRCPSGSVK
jgi:hypothetical protein